MILPKMTDDRTQKSLPRREGDQVRLQKGANHGA